MITIYLRVNRANAKALRAYRAFGFREAGSIDWEFAPGFTLHDYGMVLHLARVEAAFPPAGATRQGSQPVARASRLT